MENEESLIKKFYPSGIFVTLDSSYNLNSEYHITELIGHSFFLQIYRLIPMGNVSCGK